MISIVGYSRPMIGILQVSFPKHLLNRAAYDGNAPGLVGINVTLRSQSYRTKTVPGSTNSPHMRAIPAANALCVFIHAKAFGLQK
jgi:hypothetical protein